MINKQISKIFVGLAFSVGLLIWLAYSVDWAQVVSEFGNIKYFYLLPVTGIIIVHFWLRALRWRFLLVGGKETPLSVLFESFMIGNLATYVLPLRAGEFIRPASLALLTDIPFSRGFASVVIERFFDLATVLIVFVGIASTLTGLPDWVSRGAMSLGVVALFILSFIVIAAVAPSLSKKIVHFFCKIVPPSFRERVEHFVDQFVESAEILRNGGNLLLVVGLTAVVWWTNFLFYQLCFELCGLNGSLWHGSTVGVVLALAVAAPSAPGFVGVYQTACVAVFVLFGMTAEQAMAYAIVSHAHQFLMVLGLGFATLAKHDLSLTKIRNA